ncbi:hypothetical protein [Saccharolobus solfataricus]|uniref:Uncharacterized protein n=1 Tax=Saccharolobus solfataricus TaxID=2287 RepID=A0A157SZK2_SACSO|nr:hypothetical protein [Saccharolobus solfataricus]SAI84410.1 uncharacterised protein [Saccharolobus solfataricus]
MAKNYSQLIVLKINKNVNFRAVRVIDTYDLGKFERDIIHQYYLNIAYKTKITIIVLKVLQ